MYFMPVSKNAQLCGHPHSGAQRFPTGFDRRDASVPRVFSLRHDAGVAAHFPLTDVT